MRPISEKQSLNTLIYDEFLADESVEQIALKHKLSERDVQKIIETERKRSERLNKK